MTADRFRLRLRAPHRLQNLADRAPSTVAGTTRTARVPLPHVPGMATVLLRARSHGTTGMVTPTVTALDKNGAALATWDMATEYAPDTVTWAALHCYDLPRLTEALEVRLTAPDTAPTIVALQVTTERVTGWLPAPTVDEWTDVTADVIAITSSRGGEGRGAWFEPDGGSLSITLRGDWLHLPGGTYIEWTDGKRGQAIFPLTTLTDIELNDEGGAEATTTLTAEDEVAMLANTPRYGLIVPKTGQPEGETERDGPWQFCKAQVEQLLLSSPRPLTLEVHDPVGAWLRSEQSEQNLAGHITMAATSTGAMWCGRRNGNIMVRRVFDYFTTLNVVLADDHVAARDPALQNYCYSGLRRGAGTKDLINTVTIENYGARVPDPETPGGFQWATIPHGPFTNEASRAQWGGRSQQLQTCIHYRSPVHPEDIADKVLASAQGAPSPRQVTLNTANGWPEHLDVLDSIRVRRNRVTHDVYVTRIEHEISGGEWFVTYSLAARQTAPQKD